MAVTWKNQGPAPIRTIQPTFDLDQVGAVHTVVTHPTDPQTIWVGTVNGGIWKTTNAKDAKPNWVSETDQLASLSIGAIDVDPAKPENLVAGVGRFSNYREAGGNLIGLLKSINGGNTWDRIGGPTLNGKNISGVSIRGDIVLVTAKNGGLFRSSDGATTFTPVTGPTGTDFAATQFTDLIIDPVNNKRFYASSIGATAAIFVSEDAGATWSKIADSTSNIGIATNTDNIQLAISKNPAGDSVLHAGIVNGGKFAKLARTDNKGTNWNAFDPPTYTANGKPVGINSGGQGGINFSIAADPDDPNIVYVAGDTTDGLRNNELGAQTYTGPVFQGTTSATSVAWKPASHKGAKDGRAPHTDTRQMIFDADKNIIQVDDGGVYKLTNPKNDTGDQQRSWTTINGNLSITENPHVDWDANNKNILNGAQDNSVNVGGYNRTEPWQEWLSGDGQVVRVDDTRTDYSLQYGSTQKFGQFSVRKVDNQGIVRESATAPLNVIGQNKDLSAYEKSLGTEMPFVTPLETNKVESGWLAFSGKTRIYESKDQGKTVKDIFTLPSANDDGAQLAYGGQSDGNKNSNVLYIGTENKVYLRSQADQAPTQLTAYPGTGQIQDIAIDPTDWKKVYIAETSKIYRSTDAGDSWTDITGDLIGTDRITAESIKTIEVVPNGSGGAGVLVGGLGGVYAINNAHAATTFNWAKFGEKLPNLRVYELNYDVRDDVIVAGTLGRGAWVATNVKAEFGGAATAAPPAAPRSATVEVTVSNASASENVSTVNPNNNQEDFGPIEDPNFTNAEGKNDPEGDPTEAAGMLFTINLGTSSNNPVTAHVTTKDGTAKAGSDYEVFDEIITFLPGQLTQDVKVKVMDDNIPESDKFFYLNVTDAKDATTGAPVKIPDSQGIATIYGDPDEGDLDALGELLLGTDLVDDLEGDIGEETLAGFAADDQLDGGPGDDLVTYEFDPAGAKINLSSGTAKDGFGATDTLKNIESVIGSPFDDVIEGDSGNNTLTGGEGNDLFSYSSVPSLIKGNDVITDFTSGKDKLFVAPEFGFTSPDQVISALQTSTSPVGLKLNFTGTNGSILFADLSALTTSDILLTDPTIPPTPTPVGNGVMELSTKNYTVKENGGNATITVNRSQLGASGTVDYTTSDGTATAGADYTKTSGTLSFATTESSKTFTIPILSDDLAEGVETFNVNLSNPTNGFKLGGNQTAVVNIDDVVISLPTPTPTTPTPTPSVPPLPSIPTPSVPTPTPVVPTPVPTPEPTPVVPTPVPTPEPTPVPTSVPTPVPTPEPTPFPIPIPTPIASTITISTPVINNSDPGKPTNLPQNQSFDNVYLLTDGNDNTIPSNAFGKFIWALSGNDSLTGSGNTDSIQGNQGADTIDGADGDDFLYGGKGADQLSGSNGNDSIEGNNDNDTLNGGNGNDTMRGGKEKDILVGGTGDDELWGDKDQDILYGGTGNDVFALRIGDGSNGVAESDVIADFVAGDKIKLDPQVSFNNLTFETVNVVLDGAAPLASTAIKLGGNYLGVVYDSAKSGDLTSVSFI